MAFEYVSRVPPEGGTAQEMLSVRCASFRMTPIIDPQIGDRLFSFWAQASAPAQIEIIGGTTRLTAQIGTAWGRFIAEIDGAAHVDVTVPNNATVYFYKAKFETGDRATDWTPAPEDVDAAISDAESAAQSAQSTADSALAAAEYASEAIEALTDVVDGKTTTYYGAEAPSDAVANDIWYDTSNHKINRKTASGWTDITSEALYSALSAAGTAQATADGKIETFAQATEPTAASIGDLWIDTAHDNKLHRWSGTAWVPFRDTYLNYLVDVVDGKTTTYYGAQPSSPSNNDIWYDTSNGLIKRRVNGAWVDITNAALKKALDAADDAQSTADGKIRTFAQTTAPTGMTATDVGDLWVDTDDNNKISRWNGTTWVDLRDRHLDYLVDVVDGKTTTYYSASAPSGAVENDIWYDTTNHLIERKTASGWEDITDEALHDALSAAGTAQATADGKIRTFAQTAAPTGMTESDVGDLWIDTDDGNRLYRWSGTAWVDQRDRAIDDAQQEIDNLQIGSRNYILNSRSLFGAVLVGVYQTGVQLHVIRDVTVSTSGDIMHIS